MAESNPTSILKLTDDQQKTIEKATGERIAELKLIKFALKDGRALELIFECPSCDW